jgi:Carboxypeptidase regulatory-like domain
VFLTGISLRFAKPDLQCVRNALTPRLALFCLIAAGLVSAQNALAAGSFTGLVTDSTGAVIAKAQVLLQKMDSSLEARATTDKSGHFTMPGLGPGRYRVRVEAVGFQPAENAVTIGTEASEPAIIILPVKTAQESVTVEGSREGTR